MRGGACLVPHRQLDVRTTIHDYVCSLCVCSQLKTDNVFRSVQRDEDEIFRHQVILLGRVSQVAQMLRKIGLTKIMVGKLTALQSVCECLQAWLMMTMLPSHHAGVHSKQSQLVDHRIVPGGKYQ